MGVAVNGGLEFLGYAQSFYRNGDQMDVGTMKDHFTDKLGIEQFYSVEQRKMARAALSSKVSLWSGSTQNPKSIDSCSTIASPRQLCVFGAFTDDGFSFDYLTSEIVPLQNVSPYLQEVE